ncbi:MAG: cation diffusion facilitator family transporter [Cyanobacteria bacterium P01_A01_bin.105]
MHFHGLESCQCAPAPSPQKLRSLGLSLVLVATFSAVELRMGHHSHSLSLLADAGHMVADVFAIAMALLATWIAQWPADDRAPFGYRRVEILAALVNGVGLLLIAGWIAKAAVFQLHAPPSEILTGPMAATAALGLGVNGVNAWLLHQHAGQDLNLRGAFLHVLADAVSCLGVLLGAGAMAWRQWYWMDGVIGGAIALLIFLGSIPLLRQSLSILLALTPADIVIDDIQTALRQTDGVDQVDRLQVWAIAPGQLCLTATLTVSTYQRDRLLNQLQTLLQQNFDITDATLQFVSSPAVALSTLPSTRIRELI